MLKKLMGSLLILTMSIGVLAGCGSKAATTQSTANQGASSSSSGAATGGKVDKIKKAGVLVLGTAADYAPYEFHKVKNGTDSIQGFDIEIAKAIADELGVQLKIQDMKFNGLLAALKADSIDLIVAGMAPTEERKQSVDFSDNYLDAMQTIMIRTEDKDKLKSLDDFKGKPLAAQTSSTQEKIAKEEIPGANIVSVPEVPNLVLELKNKKVDGLVIESTVGLGYTNKYPELCTSTVQFKNSKKGSAIAMNKGNEDFVKVVNGVIAKLKGQNKIDEWMNQYAKLALED
jgi:polar amino acid transport system substrate-binding protein